MLNLRPHTDLRGGENGAVYSVCGRTQAAVVVLIGLYIAAIGKPTCFVKRLAKSDIPPHSLRSSLVEKISDQIPHGAVDFGTVVVSQ